ncbi:MAG TPA: hypothetical protein VI874_01925, partial [Candidatus Norongarragalinales archaeon]|nr:hypothetical protein [Candidatus Norongarragalinales archaeon]
MIRGPESASTLRLLNALRKAKRPVWKDVADILRKSRRAQTPMTLSRLEKLTKDGDLVVVPAKVVSSGRMSHKITLGYFAASKSALVHMKQ